MRFPSLIPGGGDVMIPPFYRFGERHPGALARTVCRVLGHQAPPVAAARYECRRCGAPLALRGGAGGGRVRARP